MNLNKKILVGSLAVVLTMSLYGCSGKNKENTHTTAVTNASTIDGGINKFYDDYLALAKEAGEKITKEKLEKLEKNIPVFKELNQKAKNTCSEDYYVETTINYSEDNGIKREIKLKVSADGSSREEEYIGGKFTYITIYSRNEDTMYIYDVAADKLDKTTKYSQKNQGHYPHQYGYFDVVNNNAWGGELKYIDYTGKRAVYIVSTYEGVDKAKNPFKTIGKYWYDAETGILIREEKEDYINGKLATNYTMDYTIKVNQSFDKDIFTFDKTKLNK